MTMLTRDLTRVSVPDAEAIVRREGLTVRHVMSRRAFDALWPQFDARGASTVALPLDGRPNPMMAVYARPGAESRSIGGLHDAPELEDDVVRASAAPAACPDDGPGWALAGWCELPIRAHRDWEA
jgi:hypothetical protein